MDNGVIAGAFSSPGAVVCSVKGIWMQGGGCIHFCDGSESLLCCSDSPNMPRESGEAATDVRRYGYGWTGQGFKWTLVCERLLSLSLYYVVPPDLEPL